MRIKDVRIKNFKAHKDTSLSLGKMSVIMGANGSGKSSLLEAVAFLFGHGVRGENVDGRNMIALVNGDDGVHVSAEVEHNGVSALISRWRSPTPSGLGRSKTSVKLLSEGSSEPFERALKGELYGVTHVHEWLDLKWTSLRKIIISLGSVDIERLIPDAVAERLKGDLSPDAINDLYEASHSKLLSLKREEKALRQAIDSIYSTLEAGSPEELEALSLKQQRYESELSQLRFDRKALIQKEATIRVKISSCVDHSAESQAFSLDIATARNRASDDYILSLREDFTERSNKLIQLESERSVVRANEERIGERLLALGGLGEVCPCCSQKVDDSILEEEEERLSSLLEEVSFRGLCLEGEVKTNRNELNKAEVKLDKAVKDIPFLARFIEHHEKGFDLEQLYRDLAGVDAELEKSRVALGRLESLHSENYKEMVKMQSALTHRRRGHSASSELDGLTAEIGSESSFYDSLGSLISLIARTGRERIVERVKAYYGHSTLGEPHIDIEQGRIGLMRDGVFYSGIALSGAERDLLAMAIDCAIKDLKGIPKVILLEADSVGPENLGLALDVLSKQVESNNIDQVLVATWRMSINPSGVKVINL